MSSLEVGEGISDDTPQFASKQRIHDQMYLGMGSTLLRDPYLNSHLLSRAAYRMNLEMAGDDHNRNSDCQSNSTHTLSDMSYLWYACFIAILSSS